MPILDLSVGEAVFAGAVLLLAAYVRGYSGFGFSAVLVAGLSFVMDPSAVIPLAITFEVMASLLQSQSIRNEVQWRKLWVLLAAAIIGNPIGVWILTSVDADSLRLGTFVVLGVLSFSLLINRQAGIRPTTLLFFVVGILAGVVNGATALSGLVLVLALSFMTVAPGAMRATLIVYFFASDLLLLGFLAWRGQIDQTLGVRIAVGLPLLGLGITAGSKVFRRASIESFRRATLAILLTISIIGLARLTV